MLSLCCRGLTRWISWSLQKLFKWQWPTLSIYFIKLQQSHWSFLPRKVLWAPVQEHRKQIPVTRSAQFSLLGDSSGKPWANDLYQHISSETTTPRPSLLLSRLPPAPLPGSCSSDPARQGAGSSGCFLTATSQVGSVQGHEGSTEHTVCSTHPRCLSSAGCPCAAHWHTHAAQQQGPCCLVFRFFLGQRTALNNYPFHLSCDHIQWPLAATLLENKVTCMLCSATARTGPREDKISLHYIVLPFFQQQPGTSDGFTQRHKHILWFCPLLFSILHVPPCFLTLADHWANALLELSSLARGLTPGDRQSAQSLTFLCGAGIIHSRGGFVTSYLQSCRAPFMPHLGQVRTLCVSFQTPCQADAVTRTTSVVEKRLNCLLLIGRKNGVQLGGRGGPEVKDREYDFPKSLQQWPKLKLCSSEVPVNSENGCTSPARILLHKKRKCTLAKE